MTGNGCLRTLQSLGGRRLLAGVALVLGILVINSPALAVSFYDASYLPGYTYNKWGSGTLGTGATVTWSFMPAGTSESSYLDFGSGSNACPGTSTLTLSNFWDPSANGGSGAFVPRDLSTSTTEIFKAFDTWASATNLTIVFDPTDSGTAINDPGAVPGTTHHILIGVFSFTGDANNVAAVGFAPPPNGFYFNGEFMTGAGDILFNSNTHFQITRGTEDTTPIDFFYGNDFEGLFLHELGHALGFDHNTVVGSVMNVTPPGLVFNVNRQLAQDDIDGIRTLYGPVPVPLPSAMWPLGTALADWLGIGRRRAD